MFLALGAVGLPAPRPQSPLHTAGQEAVVAAGKKKATELPRYRSIVGWTPAAGTSPPQGQKRRIGGMAVRAPQPGLRGLGQNNRLKARHSTS